MSNSIRVRTTPNGGDNYLKLKLDQDFDFIEILSLKISQEDAYKKFCSDYGVIVGRVVINSGFGVPNAKVSVFIPIDNIDKDNPIIKGLYPFEVVSDKNDDGLRYNLFSDEANPENKCSTKIGSFPTKREVLDNSDLLYVYCKYYKFTTTTNHAGDFMFFGVPLGTYTVHVDADISDIGVASQRPYDLISQGTPQNLFYSPTKYKGDKNLDKLIQVKTLNAGVNVQPFWGDTENCEIGITRLDLDLNYNIRPCAIFMGSIFGDQDKNSINKNCIPRKALGELCEQVAGAGSIYMIRKTIDGQIERFDVDGGRVIDDDGTWAYQIPMNLDYMVTDEEGNMIPSKDSNIGVPTRARVRFNIGMDETGSEGRLRTRARYLVPNNPTNGNELDYTFGTDTKDTSFRDLYWNKIYTVSNFISRFQKNTIFDKIDKQEARTIVGIKGVDNCAGDKTPFPYNRVDNSFNPLFLVLCIILKIIIFIMYVFNRFLLPIINFLIWIIKKLLQAICYIINILILGAINEVRSWFGWSPIGPGIDPDVCAGPSYVSCLTMECDDENTKIYAPGCQKGNGDYSGGFTTYGWDASNPKPDYYCGDDIGHTCDFSFDTFGVGLDNCLAFQLARALGIFQFDFYNDWINGSLFVFLLKYKKKKKNKAKFCEYECYDGGFTAIDSTGVNGCYSNLLLDTCYLPSTKDSQNNYFEQTLDEGLIKRYNNELYYASTTHMFDYRLYATEIVSLGSVFECDWQGIPKIQETLIPTTYKIPPSTPETLGGNVLACGMVDIGGKTSHMFFDIDCIGVHTDYKGCLNIRHICEIGVNIDEAQLDPLSAAILVQSDCIIGSNDIDDDKGKYFRDVFYGLNNSPTPWVGVNYLSIPANGFDTSFNLKNCPEYDFANVAKWSLCGVGDDNGKDYVNFRGYTPNMVVTPSSLFTDKEFTQPKHSYYFYFGILPGKTALDKMNSRFFTTCIQETDNDIIIQGSSTTSKGSDGTITFNFIGGTAPYTYEVKNSSGVVVSVGTTDGITPVIINGLAPSQYTIIATDSLNTPVSLIIDVTPPPALTCNVYVSKTPTTSVSKDGEITIGNINGGIGTYNYSLYSSNNVLLQSGPIVPPYVIKGLDVDNTKTGYKVVITDSSTGTCVTTGLTLNGTNALAVTATTKNVTCYGGQDGEININVTGGKSPITISTKGPNNYSSTGNSLKPIIAGTYVTTIVDGLGTTQSVTSVITEPKPLLMFKASKPELLKQCDPNNYVIPFYADNVTGNTITTEYKLNGKNPWNPVTLNYVDKNTPLFITLPKAALIQTTPTPTQKVEIRFKDSVPCYSNVISITPFEMPLPINVLTVSVDSITDLCTPKSVSLDVIVTPTPRPPYTFNVTGGATVTPSTISNNSTNNIIQSLTITVPSTSTYPNNANVTLTVTDGVGCVSAPIQILPQNKFIPDTKLTASKSINTNGTYDISVTGGVPPYYVINQITNNKTYSNNNNIISNIGLLASLTVYDSNGCTTSS